MLVEEILYGTKHIRVKAQLWQERLATAVKALFRPVPLCVPTTREHSQQTTAALTLSGAFQPMSHLDSSKILGF